MNNVSLTGRLTRDPEMRYSQASGEAVAVARYTLAVERRGRRNPDGPNADFISCVSFGKTAEFLEKYCKKGTKLELSGRIQTGNYTNKDGNKVYTTDVVGENLGFAESKAASAGSGTAAQAAPAEPQSAIGDEFINIPDGTDEDDLLPFN